jgi:preprotein translocase subunit SecA
VINTQRDRIYSERRRALLSGDLASMMGEYAEKTVDDILEVRLEGGACRT